jgi:hypothetical protein
MGADAFVAFYGVKIAISRTDQDTLDAFEARTEPRLRDARQHGLHAYWGRLTDGEDYFLYVGHRIGLLGVENDTYVQVPLDKLNESATRVQVRLKEAGFHERPALHLQLEAQY